MPAIIITKSNLFVTLFVVLYIMQESSIYTQAYKRIGKAYVAEI